MFEVRDETIIIEGVGEMLMMIFRMDGESGQDGGCKFHGEEPDARLA